MNTVIKSEKGAHAENYTVFAEGTSNRLPETAQQALGFSGCQGITSSSVLYGKIKNL